jgi:hypothetical protein
MLHMPSINAASVISSAPLWFCNFTNIMLCHVCVALGYSRRDQTAPLAHQRGTEKQGSTAAGMPPQQQQQQQQRLQQQACPQQSRQQTQHCAAHARPHPRERRQQMARQQ